MIETLTSDRPELMQMFDADSFGLVERRLEPFAAQALPVLDDQAAGHVDLSPNVARPEYAWGQESYRPVALTMKEAQDLAGALGVRMLHEFEWEHAYRAGSTSTFPWGDRMQHDAATSLLATALSDDSIDNARNPFGFALLQLREWCRTDAGLLTTRGGAAALYPWQDHGEWLLLVSGLRHAAPHPDEAVAVRFALP